MSLFVFIIFAGLFIFLFLLKQAIEKGLNQPSGQEEQAKTPADTSLPKKSPGVPKVAFAWAWMQCAGKYKLRYLRQGVADPYPVIEGRIDSLQFHIRAVPARDGKGFDTVMKVEYPSACLGLYLVGRKEDTAPEVPSGDISECFESSVFRKMYGFVAKGNEEIFRKEYARPCEAFLTKHLDSYMEFTLSDNYFQIRFRGAENDPECLEEKIEHLENAGQFFGTLSGHVASLLKNPGYSVGDNGVKAEPLSIPEVDTGEKTSSMDTVKKVEVPPRSPVQTIPEPVAETAEEKTPIPEPVAETAEENAEDLTKETVAKSLWSQSFPGNAEKKLFDTQYKGKEVCWEGILRGAFPYNFDIVFGQQSGIKATVELLEIAQGNSSFKVKIKALVSFPPEEAARLRNSSGRPVRFQGTLLKFEALSREVYLSHGKILSAGE